MYETKRFVETHIHIPSNQIHVFFFFHCELNNSTAHFAANIFFLKHPCRPSFCPSPLVAMRQCNRRFLSLRSFSRLLSHLLHHKTHREYFYNPSVIFFSLLNPPSMLRRFNFQRKLFVAYPGADKNRLNVNKIS